MFGNDIAPREHPCPPGWTTWPTCVRWIAMVLSLAVMASYAVDDAYARGDDAYARGDDAYARGDDARADAAGGTDAATRGMTHAASAPEVVVEGIYERRLASMHDGSSLETHHVVNDHESIELPRSWVAGKAWERGAKYRVWGRSMPGGRQFEVDAWARVDAPVLPRIRPTFGRTRKVAVIHVYWDSPETSRELGAALFSGGVSTRAFFAENSYRIEQIGGDVFGPYVIPKPVACDYDAIGRLARDLATDAGHDLTAYAHVMVYFEFHAQCPWLGMAAVGTRDAPARDSWINGDTGCRAITQELAHNFGLVHTHAYECRSGETSVPYSDTCERLEYAPYDVMGHGCGHVNVVHKAHLGWLSACNVITARTDGTYLLLPSQLPCDGPQALRIELGADEFYYLEYRRALGQFDAIGGVMVYASEDHRSEDGPHSHLLDMQPELFGEFLPLGRAYVDHRQRVTIELLERNDTHASIRLTFPEGGRGVSQCEDGTQPPRVFGSIGTLACADAPATPDWPPPDVRLESPEHGATFELGTTIDVVARAHSSWIDGVWFRFDGVDQARLSQPPFASSLKLEHLGDTSIEVVADDGSVLARDSIVVHVVEPAATDGDEPMPPHDDASEGCGCRQRGPHGLVPWWAWVFLLRRRARSTCGRGPTMPATAVDPSGCPVHRGWRSRC